MYTKRSRKIYKIKKVVTNYSEFLNENEIKFSVHDFIKACCTEAERNEKTGKIDAHSLELGDIAHVQSFRYKKYVEDKNDFLPFAVGNVTNLILFNDKLDQNNVKTENLPENVKNIKIISIGELKLKLNTKSVEKLSYGHCMNITIPDDLEVSTLEIKSGQLLSLKNTANHYKKIILNAVEIYDLMSTVVIPLADVYEYRSLYDFTDGHFVSNFKESIIKFLFKTYETKNGLISNSVQAVSSLVFVPENKSVEFHKFLNSLRNIWKQITLLPKLFLENKRPEYWGQLFYKAYDKNSIDDIGVLLKDYIVDFLKQNKKDISHEEYTTLYNLLPDKEKEELKNRKAVHKFGL